MRASADALPFGPLSVDRSWRAGESPPEQHPLLNFDERDLFRFAEGAGFEDIRMDYRAEVKFEQWTTSWETFRRSSGNPLAPTPEEEIAEALEPAERAAFEAYLRKVIESRPRVRQWRAARIYGT